MFKQGPDFSSRLAVIRDNRSGDNESRLYTKAHKSKIDQFANSMDHNDPTPIQNIHCLAVCRLIQLIQLSQNMFLKVCRRKSCRLHFGNPIGSNS